MRPGVGLNMRNFIFYSNLSYKQIQKAYWQNAYRQSDMIIAIYFSFHTLVIHSAYYEELIGHIKNV